MNRDTTLETSQTDWGTVDRLTDEDIDLSDIPEVTAEQMAGATRRINGYPVTSDKIQVVLQLDTDIVAYFKARAGNQPYQTLINHTLKASIHPHYQLEAMLRRVIREEMKAVN